MSFEMNEFIKPNFDEEKFCSAKDCKMEEVKLKAVAPENFHATSIFPEYFKIDGK